MLNYYQLLATGNWKLATVLSPSIRHTLYEIRSTKDYVRKNNLFMQNKANFQKVKLNVNKVLTRDYEQMDTWSIRKTKPIQSQFKANQSQLKPIKCQNKPNSNPNKPNFKDKNILLRLPIPFLFSCSFYTHFQTGNPRTHNIANGGSTDLAPHATRNRQTIPTDSPDTPRFRLRR
jgi:hypothetical protein